MSTFIQPTPKHRSSVRYDQCPWSLEHIEAIYEPLEGRIIADGGWHPFPKKGMAVSIYRVFDNLYFQALFSPRMCPLLASLMELTPVPCDDDSEWYIKPIAWYDGFALSSTFTVTPGLFHHQIDLADWLHKYGLGFVRHRQGLSGVAYFSKIDTACLASAMDRLVWLENAIIELNVRLSAASEAFWNEVKRDNTQIDSVSQLHGIDAEWDPLPARFRRVGRKSRRAHSELS